MIVKNEYRFVWYSVMSVIDYVDDIYLWDTGSTDGTIEIIKDIYKKYPKKIHIKLLKGIDKNSFTDVRNAMLTDTKADWFIIVDGDEIWWKDSIHKLVGFIRENGEKYDSVVSKYYNLSGDMYHIQSESMGKYNIDNKKGHITIRAVNNSINGLNFGKPHGQQGLFDSDGILIQNRDVSRRYHMDGFAYIHATNISRSINVNEERKVIKRAKKFKYDIGVKLPLDFYYPESFFIKNDLNLVNIWNPRGLSYEMIARLEAPLKKIKNLFVRNKVGY